MKYAVSVIVPMYNVENFVGKCARQLFEQSLIALEIIFVDDCSPDQSSSVIEKILLEYPDREAHVKIIRHEVNRGLPSARNSGLDKASGEYIFHCDGDDWLESSALEDLHQKAIAAQSDLVFCDWYLSFKDNERYMSQNPDSLLLESRTYVELMLGGKLKYNVWNKLIKREVYQNNGIRFPDGYGMGEDMCMIELAALSNKVSYLPKALYHYVQLNNEAFTKKQSENHFNQIKYNVDHIIAFLKTYYDSSIEIYIEYFKLNIKLPFLISADEKSYNRWLEWYPEANVHIDKNPLFSYRTKIIQKAALRRKFWFLKLYYHLVIRVVYGLIYK